MDFRGPASMEFRREACTIDVSSKREGNFCLLRYSRFDTRRLFALKDENWSTLASASQEVGSKQLLSTTLRPICTRLVNKSDPRKR